MKVTTQDGKVFEIKQIEMQGNIIYGNAFPPKDRIELGRYNDSNRTIEVYAEIGCIGWNEKNGEYVMPPK